MGGTSSLAERLIPKVEKGLGLMIVLDGTQKQWSR